MANTTTTARRNSPPAHRVPATAPAAAPAAGAEDDWEEVPHAERATADGSWWRPEPGDVLECVIRDERDGKYGSYFIASRADNSVILLNAHADIAGVPHEMWLRITYIGRDDNGRRHLYDVRRAPNRPTDTLDDIPF